jgi:hypothetical protein
MSYGGFGFWGSGWWFSIILLWRRIDMAFCIAMVLIFLKVFLMVTMGILKLVSSAFIDGMWAVAMATAVMTISGLIFHPLEAMLAISGLYCYFLLQLLLGRICHCSM